MSNSRPPQGMKKDVENEIKHLKLLLASSPAVIYTSEPFGDYAATYISENVTNVMGYQPTDFLGDPNFWPDHIHSQDKEHVFNEVSLLFEKDFHLFEYRFLHKDGNYRWMRDEMKLIRDADGNPLEIIGSWIDITSRKKAQLALVESEERYRTFVHNFQGIAFRGTMDFLPIFFHGSVEKVTGYSEKDFVSGTPSWDKVIFPEDLPKSMEDGKKMCTIPNFSYQREYRIVKKDGQITWVYEIAHNICDSSGNPEFVEGTIYDITERKQTEENLRKNKTLLLKIAENFPNSYVSIINKDYSIGFTSGQEFKKQNLDPSQFIGMTLKQVFGDQADTVCKHYEKTFKGEEQSFELFIDNQYQLYRTVPLVSEDGSIPQILTVVENITAQKQAEEEKAQLESQLRQTHKMEAIGTLTGGIAHDFNNILAIILGNAELANIYISDDHPAKHNIDQLLSASNRAKDLVKRLLTFSRQDKGEIKPHYLCRLVDEYMETLRLTIPKSVKLKVNIPPKCRDNIDECLMIHVDPTQIQQLLMNLCVNALHAMDEEGTLEISVDEAIFKDDIPANRLGVTPGTYECLAVSDTGHGVNPELIDKIFDPFFTTKDVDKGTGIGLSVVQGIIKSHDGHIFVESEPAKGTIFHIYFPATTATNITKPETKFDKNTPLPTGNERILYVDDEEMLADVGKSMLEELGYSVTTHTKSTEALELFQNDPNRFDLVITDQDMPNIQGSELAIQLLQVRPDIPIILCTGYSGKIDKEKTREIGIREFALKPLDNREIALLIRKVLDGTV